MAISSRGFRGFHIAGILLGILFTLGLLAQLVVWRFFSTGYVEEFLEKNLNASAEVEKVKVNLFARRVTLQGLTLLPKESSESETGVEVGEVRLGVKAFPLMARKLETTRFIISKPQIRFSLNEKGDLSLAELFRSPKDSKGGEKEANKSSSPKERVLEARKNSWLAKLEETRLEGGSVEMFFEKEKLFLKVENLEITINDLQFDPEDLATLNQVKMDLSAQAQLFDSEELLLGNLNLEGGADGKLFNEKTGEFDADVVADLSLRDGSYLNPQVKIVRKIWSYLDQVEKWGVSLGSLPEQIGFGRSRRIVASYRNDKVTLSEPLSLSAGKWELGLARDSWLATESGQHEIGVEFLAGKKVSETLEGWFQALPKEARSFAQSRFVDEQQVLWRVNSRGELKEPQLDFLSQLPETQGVLEGLEDSLEDEVDRLKEKAGSFLKDLLD